MKHWAHFAAHITALHILPLVALLPATFANKTLVGDSENIPCNDDWEFMDRRVDPGTCVQYMRSGIMVPGDSCYPKCWDNINFVMNGAPNTPVVCNSKGVLEPSPHSYICSKKHAPATNAENAEHTKKARRAIFPQNSSMFYDDDTLFQCSEIFRYLPVDKDFLWGNCSTFALYANMTPGDTCMPSCVKGKRLDPEGPVVCLHGGGLPNNMFRCVR